MMNKVVFGIDVGGTTIKCGFFSDDGELIEKEELPTRKEIPVKTFYRILQNI